MKKNKIFSTIFLIFLLLSFALSTDASDLSLTGVITSGVYEANNIITQNYSVVEAGSYVIFLARNSITLNPDFHVESGSRFHARTDDDNAPDSDGDGLADWWEMVYFDSLVESDPNDDPDSDGCVNYWEYRLLTSPIDINNKPNPGYHYQYGDLNELKAIIYLSENYSNSYEIQYQYDNNGNRTKKIIRLE